MGGPAVFSGPVGPLFFAHTRRGIPVDFSVWVLYNKINFKGEREMLLFVILAAVAVVILLVSYAAYRIPFYHPQHTESPYDLAPEAQYDPYREAQRALIAEQDAVPFEPAEIAAYDGAKLFGRCYHVSDGAPVLLCFHGFKSTALRDMSPAGRMARQMGLNALLVDQRSHGKSDGKTISFGVKERMDCLSWARYAAQRWPGSPIVLMGVSMGAATVLMASDLDLPGEVRGIIADCPYSDPSAIIKKVGRDSMGPASILLYPFILLGARLYGGFSLTAASPVKAVRHAKVPILLIHGEDDRFVPCDMSREIYDACTGPKTRVTIPGAPHAIAYILDPERYERTVRAFLASVGIEAQTVEAK